MKKGFLSQYFTGVAGKRLSAVEADKLTSHQHEFNGVRALKDILGEPDERVEFHARFLYFTDQDADPVVEDGFLSWYDSRKNQPHRSAEYRLYFPDNLPLQCASAGDYLIVAKLSDTDNSLLALIMEKDTTIERQIRWLFGLGDESHPGYSVRADLESEQDRIGFAARFILEQIGIEPEEEAPNYLDQMLARFDGGFPRTSDPADGRGGTPGRSAVTLKELARLAGVHPSTVSRVANGDPSLRIHENRAVEAHVVGAFLHEFAPPRALHVVFELNAQRAVVPCIGKAAIDFGAWVDISARLAQRHNFVHRLFSHKMPAFLKKLPGYLNKKPQ